MDEQLGHRGVQPVDRVEKTMSGISEQGAEDLEIGDIQRAVDSLERKVQSVNTAVAREQSTDARVNGVEVSEYVPELRDAIERLTASLQAFSSRLGSR